MASTSTHLFRVSLQDAPTILREIEIASDKKLVDLAQAIVRAFDFEFDHAFGFYSALTGREVMRQCPVLQPSCALMTTLNSTYTRSSSSRNASLLMAHSQSQEIGSRSLSPSGVRRYSVLGGTTG